MADIQNPFIVTGEIPEAYFCDRRTETQRLEKSLVNGRNVVLISPRRMGKTGLIQHCSRRREIAGHYITIFLNILHTNNLQEFTFFLGKTVFEALRPRGERLLKSFLSALRSLHGKFGFDISTGLPSFDIELGDVEQPEYTLTEIFGYLAQADRPCIVTIDEFQQITRYPEQNVEALLRTHIEKIRNCRFIFSGSKRHIMQEMFFAPNRPFYQSADLQSLAAIERSKYVPFIRRNFEAFGKRIAPETAEYLYDLFEGHTYYVQKTANEAFANVKNEAECCQENIDFAVDEILSMNATAYAETLSLLSESQKPLLVAIAKAGKAENVQSSDFVRRYRLKSASSVQAALRKLLEIEMLTRDGAVYSISDRFLGMWLRKLY